MENYGETAISFAENLKKDLNDDIAVYNVGYYSGSNSEYVHKRYEEHGIILYLHQGTATVFFHGKKYQLSSGSIFIFPPKENVHILYNADTQNERYYIFYNGNNFNYFLKKLNITNFFYHVGSFIDFITISLKLLDDFKKNNYSNSLYKKILLLEIFAKLHDIVNPLSTNNDFYSSSIEPAIQHMKSNVKEKMLPVESYADMCSLSVVTLVKYFKLTTKLTPTRFFINLKIKNAQSLLTNTNKSISEIAYYLNYESPFYFSRIFKQVTGKSPLQYRKKGI